MHQLGILLTLAWNVVEISTLDEFKDDFPDFYFIFSWCLFLHFRNRIMTHVLIFIIFKAAREILLFYICVCFSFFQFWSCWWPSCSEVVYCAFKYLPNVIRKRKIHFYWKSFNIYKKKQLLSSLLECFWNAFKKRY